MCAVVVVGALATSCPVAWADFEPGGKGTSSETQTNGDRTGDEISASAGAIVFDRSKNGTGPSAGPVTPTTSWTPPACWYPPTYTPATLKAYLEPIWNAESTGSQWDLEQRNTYQNGGEEPGTYKDFNQAKTGQGYWWDSYANETFPPGWDTCTKPIFWVDKGDPPPADAKNAVTPQILAQLAYNKIRVPATTVTLAPANTTKVNLPTWAWLDHTTFTPVSVTASVPALGISATTTAQPVSLTIDPGTPDAHTYPASGTCPIHHNHIGTPYTPGHANQTPPCGLTYLHSSGTTTYPLKATITWKIHWTGTGTPGQHPLPDGTFGSTQNITVQEIQSINR
ncbi:hypothetical protein ACIRPX_25325 [Streptomyces sp. NPDC101225]|uniref:hypothetical protein n=1 Tax=Streptomyces sp. NPDC101225 TaxID=3366135 RepID=UPI0037F372DF